MSDQASFQQLLVTNFGLSPSGYAGSRGDTGYVGSGGLGYTGSSGIGYTGSAAAGPSVPTITAITYSGDDTATSPAGGDTITLTGSGFLSGATVVINGAQASVVSVVDSTTITFTAPANSAGSYIVYVINANGTTALLVPGIQYSGTPVWSTAAGSLGSVIKLSSFTANVVAIGDAPITYSVYSGTLPSGLTLEANTGVISGTSPNVSSSTTYNFTIRSTDAQLQDTDRTFAITVVPINPPTAVQYLVVAGGGGGGSGGESRGGGGGGGGGGYRTATGFAVSFGSPITVTVGAGGAGGTVTGRYTEVVGSRGGQSFFAGSISTVGGGYGGPSQNSGQSGGSGGGGGQSGTGGAGTAGEGNAGGTATYGSGGGGAGAVGSGGTASGGGAGGAGSLAFDGNYYAGGGGGAGNQYDTDPNTGTGGTGGGGRGGAYGAQGTFGTGGGGGGSNGSYYNSAKAGAAGGSGVVMIRYADSFDAAVSTTGSPTYTVSGGYRIYKWTSSGSITF
jgi:hypothetical protein